MPPLRATAPALDVAPSQAQLSFDRTLRLALDTVAGLPVLPMRSAALASCHDRVIAERVRVQADLPPQDVAMVDGYAIDSEACRRDGPWRFRLTGRNAAARASTADTGGENRFPSREAVRVTVGATIPAALDTVIPLSATQKQGESVTLHERPEPGAAIRGRGAQARCGDVLAEGHRLLDARSIATLANAGISAVKVRRTLRVGLFSVGGGRQDAEAVAARAMMMAALDRRWIGSQDTGAMAAGSLVSSLRSMSQEMDMAVGIDRPGLTAAIEDAGGRVVVAGVPMHPGGGAQLALLNDMAILLLPSDPVAALTAMAVFGWPLLRRRAGIHHARATPRAGVAAFSLATDAEHAACPLIRVAGAGETPTLEVLLDPAEGGEGSLTRLVRADGIALLAPGQAVRFGGRVPWLPLGERFT